MTELYPHITRELIVDPLGSVEHIWESEPMS